MIPTTQMNFHEFSQLAKQYGTIPVYKRIMADLLTPISAYMRMVRDARYAFLMESVEQGTRYTRYSYIGRNPKVILTHREESTIIVENGEKKGVELPFLDVLRGLMNSYCAPKLRGLPPFSGGLVGYLGYETATWGEAIPVHHGGGLDIADSVFMLFEEIIAFDHLKNQVVIFTNVSVDDETNLEQAFEEARRHIDATGQVLHADIQYGTPVKTEPSRVISDTPRQQFEQAVRKAKQYIVSGDIFQVVLSQRFRRRTSIEPITLYRALRTINPSPYMFYLKIDDVNIIGASPELLVKAEDGEVEMRPIAGTRPRGRTRREDGRLEADLLGDEKERAEHLMLLDLARNDVGRVAEMGTVRVEEYMSVERYSHVMHLVSGVKGKLGRKHDNLDALFSGFPAGTTTGAPKIRAMEIIHELETHRRDIYSGAVGYLDFTGNMNTCIAIRVLLMKEGVVYFQSGAGIVYDSDPSKEYEETVNKARAILGAIDLAENGLVGL